MTMKVVVMTKYITFFVWLINAVTSDAKKFSPAPTPIIKGDPNFAVYIVSGASEQITPRA